MHPRRVLAGLFGALLILSTALVAPPPVAAESVSLDLATAAAIEWLATQQQPDGGFEVAMFPGFETPEAVLALAAQAQTGPSWSGRQALLGAQRVATPAGLTGLDYLDDYAEATGPSAITGGIAAKLITLVTAPLCLSATSFDPQADGAVDLAALVKSAARPNGAYGADGVLSDTLYAVLALVAMGEPVPPSTIAYIHAAQEADGGWNFTGSPADQGFDDVDTTALAIQALVAAGGRDSEPVTKGAAYLAGIQSPDSSWGGDPNSTAVAMLALRAAGVKAAKDGRSFLLASQGNDGRVASPNDSFGVNTYATTQAVRGLLEVALPTNATAGTCAGGGYFLFEQNGAAIGLGDAASYPGVGASNVVGGAVTATGQGYYLFGSDGGVFTFGDAPFKGSLGGTALNRPIVGGTPMSTNAGYHLFASDGGVFTFGTAPFLGSMGGTRLDQPIVGGALTPTGKGYVLVARDGGVFAFGDAEFKGSMGGHRLDQPVTGIAVSPLGEGYVLFARDGGMFTFGDAPFLGSAKGRLGSPVVAGAFN